jgi:type I restriction enzyme, S subunit
LSVPEDCIYPDITKRVHFRRDQSASVDPAFAVLAWNHSVVHNQVLRRAKTSNGTLKINNRDVSQITMPVPPRSEQQTLVEQAESAQREVDALTREVTSLETLKETLRHGLLTGAVPSAAQAEMTAGLR